MIAWLRSIRLTLTQLALVGAVSAVATALVIATATSHPSVPSARIAALAHRVVVRTVPRRREPATPAPSAAAAPASSPSPSSPAGSSSAGSAPAPPVSATTGATADAGAPDDSGATHDSGATADSGTTGDTDTTSSTSSTTPSTSASTTPAKPTYKVKHVFIISLTTTSYQTAFGHGSVAHYLNGTLRRRGTLLSGYHTLGPAELPDYLAMVSGQASNADTRADCPMYAEFSSAAKTAADGPIGGRGCVYPNTVLTIGDQVTSSGKQWKAYIDDMGSSSCVHPNSNAVDDTQLTGAGSEYTTRHNPFIYFHSLLDLGDCSNDDVSLDRLPKDLRSVATTPTYAYVAPGICDDTRARVCPDGKPGGLAGEDAFLQLWVPRILGSPAYQRDGALIIAFATSTWASGNAPDRHPIRVGALILSRYAKRGRTVSTSYGPYTILRSVEDLFGYDDLAQAHTAKSFVSAALPGAAVVSP
jgi:hypothetical protein